MYAPQSKEDSDIFNRFLLNGYKFVQTWEGFVYHMTCRGSRFADGAKRNPNGEVFMKNRETDEWLAQNIRSTRNFIRKKFLGNFVKHNFIKPIVPPKILELLEPWCSVIYCGYIYIEDYIEKENIIHYIIYIQGVRTLHSFQKQNHGVEVKFDGSKFNNDSFQIIQQLSEILANDEELEVGEFNLDIFRIKINDLNTYEKSLIVCKK